MRATILSLLLLSLSLPVSAQTVDHIFFAPETVVAEPDGHFAVALRVTLGTGGGSFGHGYLEGLQNCPSQLIADGFCILERPEGETIEVYLDGTLEDPSAPGRVYVEASICADQGSSFWTAEVDVEPFSVPTAKESFGLVKARYRR